VVQTWQIQEAKNRLSEVVERALLQGPQVITRRGVKVVVVVSYAEYNKMIKQQKKLSDFLHESPLSDIELERDRSPARSDVTL